MPAVGRLVLAGALLASTGCNAGGKAATSATPTRAKAPWAADARTQLLSLCREQGTQRYCTCLIDRLEQRYTVEEFAALSTNAMGQAIGDLGATCPDAPRR